MNQQWKPFGKDWVGQMLTYSKAELIDLIRTMGRRKIAACEAIENGNYQEAVKILNGMADDGTYQGIQTAE